MRGIKQWLKSVIHPSKEYYLLHGRDMDVTVFKKGKKTKMNYWNLIDMIVESVNIHN